MAESISEMIMNRPYLLEFQKNQLIIDMESVPSDNEQIGHIIDRIFYRLFGKGWDSLTGLEIQDIYTTWKGD